MKTSLCESSIYHNNNSSNHVYRTLNEHYLLHNTPQYPQITQKELIAKHATITYRYSHKSICAHCLIVTFGLYLLQQIIDRTLKTKQYPYIVHSTQRMFINAWSILNTHRDVLNGENSAATTASLSLDCHCPHPIRKSEHVDLAMRQTDVRKALKCKPLVQYFAAQSDNIVIDGTKRQSMGSGCFESSTKFMAKGCIKVG